jgi:hypothetical protein
MAGRGEHMASGHRIHAVERQAAALRLRAAGRTYQAIARALGYGSVSAVETAITRALRATQPTPNAEERALDLERLDALHAAIWPRAMAGDLAAVDGVVKVMERRARMLGLGGPSW